MTPQIIRCIEANKPLAVLNKLIKEELLRQDRAKFDADIKAEYDELFPKYEEYKELIADAPSDVFERDAEREFNGWNFIKSDELYDYWDKPIDYSEDENYKTFEEYKNETRVIQEAVEEVLDEDGIILTEAIQEVSELVRPYIPVEVTDEMIQAELDNLPEYKEYLSKQKQYKLNNLYVTVNDKVFDAHLEARLNMATAIQASSLTNQTETQWKMYDNSVQTVTIGELQQALILALTEVGKTIGAIDENTN
jgi:hypothetical protein